MNHINVSGTNISGPFSFFSFFFSNRTKLGPFATTRLKINFLKKIAKMPRDIKQLCTAYAYLYKRWNVSTNTLLVGVHIQYSLHIKIIIYKKKSVLLFKVSFFSKLLTTSNFGNVSRLVEPTVNKDQHSISVEIYINQLNFNLVVT